MQFLSYCVLLYFVSQVYGVSTFWQFDNFGFWKRKNRIQDAGVSGYLNSVSFTGRVFVTMFGYPSKCEKKGLSHSCTLSFACWLAGGSSQSGCGANPWIVACCITKKNHHQGSDFLQKFEKVDELSDNELDNGEDEFAKLELREDTFPPTIQKRNDVMDDFKQSCGLSNDRVMQKRIVGGKEARFGQFPWQAYIKISSYQCGGVLVSKNIVATAAHCILSAELSDILVYLGELDTQDTGKVKELAPAELHRVKKRIFHPKFSYRSTQPDRYDLALLELRTEAGYSYHISPICLPEKSMKLTGRNAVVAGWGKINPTNHLMGTNVLRSVSVPILDISECMAWHKMKQIVVELHPEMLCAGHKSGKQDACLGDSGGPLIVLENGKWTLVGITSAGFGCGEPHQPGIYHKIPVSVQWIKSIVNKNM